MTDSITLAVFLAPWALFLVWELYLLAVRIWGTTKPAPRTISMVARDYGWKLNSVVYTQSAMVWHWWWPGKSYGSTAGTIAFWGICAALLFLDAWVWLFKLNPLEFTFTRWLRFPLLWVVVGALAAVVLFPQAGEMP